MATSVKRELAITFNNASGYLTATGCYVSHDAVTDNAIISVRLQSTTGYATVNAAGMDVLFPNAAAKPYKCDSGMSVAANTYDASNKMTLQINGASIHQVIPNGSSYTSFTQNDITVSAVVSATKSSVIRWLINKARTTSSVYSNTNNVALYFWQYSFAAVATGGVSATNVSSAVGFDGDSVSFSAVLKAGAEWRGWYSDAACTTLVSTDLNYTVTVAGADVTLYAYAVPGQGTGIYIKVSGAYSEAAAAYKRVSGVWEAAGISDFESGQKYTVINV